MSFEDFNIKDTLLRGIYSYGFEQPSSIQIATIPKIIEGRDIVAQGHSGIGKCLAKDTEVLMFSGELKKVQDIQVGEYIMGDDSTSRSVLATGSGTDGMYTITNTDGDTYTVNSQHILSLRLSLDSITITDEPENQLYIMKWLNVANYKFKTMTFNYSAGNKKLKYKEVSHIKQCIYEHSIVDINIKEYMYMSRTIKDILHGYRVIIDFPDKHLDIDPYDYGLKYKTITPSYVCNSRCNRLRLLGGLLDSYNTYEFKFGNTSKLLTEKFVYLCKSLGFNCDVTDTEIQVYGTGMYDIPRESELKKSEQMNTLVLPIEITFSGIDEYYGFVLDGNHRFVLGNFIVSHNTAAFTISSLEVVDPEIKSCQIIILSPTRELAIQTHNVITHLAKYMNDIQIELCIGGVQNARNIQTAQIVIATPGRLINTLHTNRIDNCNLKMLVVDEADEMLSQGFVEQLHEIISSHITDATQIALFSATFPESLKSITDKFLRNPEKIYLNNNETTVEGIEQFYIDVEAENNKFSTLCDLYHSMEISQAIIYASSKRRVQIIGERLVSRGYTVSIIHGDLSQVERNSIMNDFRSGATRILLSSDLISRGIDVQSVNLVINYDFPLNFESYIHRIGRSGRFGRKGLAITFITTQERATLTELENFYSTQINEFGIENLGGN